MRVEFERREISRYPPLMPLASDAAHRALIQALADSIESDPWSLPPADAPQSDALAGILARLRNSLFPRATAPTPRGHGPIERFLAANLASIRTDLQRDIATAFACVRSSLSGGGNPAERAEASVEALLAELPAIRRILVVDAQAAFDGDPAARSVDEVLLCYPGFFALLVHRVAHKLHLLGVPLVPRMMSEYAHATTGIDIHPGATIGQGFFIDHGTGVTIGETTEIGDFCKVYQCVTLGAKSFERDENGALRKGYKRHPTLEDHVTVYAGATILGGDTRIGKGSVIASGVFVTQSVPPHHLVAPPRAELRVLEQRAGI